jgi:hypothetical protein
MITPPPLKQPIESKVADAVWQRWFSSVYALLINGISASGFTMSPDKMLGRTTSGIGAVEEISVDAGLSLSSGSLSIPVNGIDTTMIQDHAATLAKLATQADQTILGNISGSSASPQALTPSQIKTMLAIAIGDVSGLTAALAALSAGAIHVNYDQLVAQTAAYHIDTYGMASQGHMHNMTITQNLAIPSGWCNQMVAPVVETGVTVTVEAGGLWFVNA